MNVSLRTSLLVLAVLLHSSLAPSTSKPTQAEEPSTEPPADSDKPEGLVHWTDGGILPGRPVGMDGTHLLWESSLFAQPLSFDMSKIDWMKFGPVRDMVGRLENAVDQPFDWFVWQRKVDRGDGSFTWDEKRWYLPPRFLSLDRHHLTYASARSTGTLRIADGGIQWTPFGGEIPCAVAPGRRVRFELHSWRDVKPLDGGELVDKLVTVDGEIWPCRIEAFEDASLRVRLPFGDPRSVPMDDIKAVELGLELSSTVGFDAIPWRVKEMEERLQGAMPRPRLVMRNGQLEFVREPPVVKKGAARISDTENKVVVNRGATLTTPRYATPGPHTMRFTVDWTGQSEKTWLHVRWINGDTWSDGDGFELSFASREPPDIEIGVHEYLKGQYPLRLLKKSVRLGDDRKTRVLIEVSEHTITRIVVNEVEIFSEESFNASQDHTRTTKKPYRKLQFYCDDAVNMILSDLEVLAPGPFLYQNADRRILTLPRFLRSDPPSHVLLGANGDLLRGRFLGADDKHVRFRSGTQDLEFDRSKIAGLVWLHPDTKLAEPDDEPKKPDEDAEVEVLMEPDFRLFLKPEKTTDTMLVGQSRRFGTCSLPLESILEVRVGRHAQPTSLRDYADWAFRYAINPRWNLIEAGSEGAASMVGKKTEPVDLPLLDGGRLKLPDPAGRVVVLDFWASWCAPCMNAMPTYLDAIDEFDPEKVRLVAVNQGESAEVIKACLDTRDWDVAVAMDFDEVVAKQLGIDTLPHTLVIDKTGIVRRSQSGFGPRSGEELKQAIEELINDSSSKLPGS